MGNWIIDGPKNATVNLLINTVKLLQLHTIKPLQF